MEYVIVVLSMLLVAVCALGVALAVINEKEDSEAAPSCEDETTRYEREKEAHYMRNFWSYDGSEQQEWDE